MIKSLTQEVAEDLCAQQVVTSLPDCIKELVDNSIDAGATEIRVLLHSYGKKSLTVVDNGCGIANFDCLGKVIIFQQRRKGLLRKTKMGRQSFAHWDSVEKLSILWPKSVKP